ncbi:alpha/beta fold hydrolase [Lentiprolixibacter aurantiacus]|uniref:Alpha/beta hydrolase n=1 Tax=Lentiprolixibacter aurantiacus TaxID=2993939 RepID=A0AAE3MJW4_9FLAO|nr:alpha/beta hydrolase [Lentiprolixibacter aurantiacus]MCX2718789.1 alpha/beta hydrolase [Lentiprolixibacter aurantiacus]
MNYTKGKPYNPGLFIVLLLFFLNLSIGQEIKLGTKKGNYVEINNAKLYYEMYGDGSPLILLHGGLGSISNFKAVIPELSKHFKIFAVDSPGHGKSEQIDSLSYQIIADHIAGFIDKMHLSDVKIVGYSDGAIIGLLVSNLKPERVSKLIFGAGALGPGNSKPEGLAMLKNFSAEMLPPEWEKNYRQISPNPDYWDQFIVDSKNMWLQEVWIPREILPEIQSKVLVMFGDRDPFIPLEHAIEIYKLLPNSELCVLPDIPHELFNFPDITNPLMINFLVKD